MTARTDAPVVIEARGVEKTFRISPRSRHPRLLRALRGVSFDVRRGEFFGIVGRNGSGKSTLLKVLASIYRADAGRIRMAGRLAPFIELGVGFNPELTARENVALNGVMMGLGRREAARRLDGVLAFAELEEFVDLKLKNYSSGMLVRLAFSVMVETDADIMLVDEVLAVGDAAFAQRCMDVFRAKRAAGRTLVLVTHDMSTVQAFCDRAMLLHEGEVRYLGDPEEAALRYYRLNFSTGGDDAAGEMPARVLDAWLQDEAGERVESVPERAPIAFGALVEAHQDLVAPTIGFQVLNRDGVVVLGFGAAASPGHGGAPRPVAPGERVRVTGRIDNPLLPGRYTLSCSMARDGAPGDLALRVPRLVEFEVHPAPWRAIGGDAELGMVSVREDVRAVLEA